MLHHVELCVCSPEALSLFPYLSSPFLLSFSLSFSSLSPLVLSSSSFSPSLSQLYSSDLPPLFPYFFISLTPFSPSPSSSPLPLLLLSLLHFTLKLFPTSLILILPSSENKPLCLLLFPVLSTIGLAPFLRPTSSLLHQFHPHCRRRTPTLLHCTQLLPATEASTKIQEANHVLAHSI